MTVPSFARGGASVIRVVHGAMAVLIMAIVLGCAGMAAAQQPAASVDANTRERPTVGLTASNDAELLRALRGAQGMVTIPDHKAAVLIQPQGREWREWVKGPVRVLGSWLVLGMLGLLILFYLLRGRIAVDSGFSGRTVQRFNAVERFTHWLTASAFVVLALTGLNILYGRYILLPILGPDLFTTISIGGKYAHNFMSFAFMVGLVLMLVLWVHHNIPNRYDFQWLAVAGGLFRRGSHPPAGKFNAGQKFVFWSVILGGAAISVTGIYLLFPFYFSDIHLLQVMQVIHSVVSLLLIAVIIAHIYIGSLGMEGAWDAMGTGYVDENWAREHHSIWMAKAKGEPLPRHGDD